MNVRPSGLRRRLRLRWRFSFPNKQAVPRLQLKNVFPPESYTLCVCAWAQFWQLERRGSTARTIWIRVSPIRDLHKHPKWDSLRMVLMQKLQRKTAFPKLTKHIYHLMFIFYTSNCRPHVVHVYVAGTNCGFIVWDILYLSPKHLQLSVGWCEGVDHQRRRNPMLKQKGSYTSGFI